MKTLLLLLFLGLPHALSAQVANEEAQSERIEKRLRLADELALQGDADGALEILQDLTQSDPENSDLRKRIAGLLIQTERIKEAIPHLQKMLELEEGSAAAYSVLGRLMMEADEFEAAVPVLEDAAKRFPDAAEFPFLLSSALARLERWAEAITQFETTVALAKGDQAALLNENFYFRYGAAHERAGNYEESVKLFRKTLELLRQSNADEGNTEMTSTVLNFLAYMWVERGDNLDEAGTMALEAAALSPESGAIADTLGWYHFQIGDYPRALSELQKAERLIEEPDPVIFDHLGQTLAKLNEKSFAAEYFRKALALDPKNEAIQTRLAEVEK